MAEKLFRLTREQLAKFVKDPRTIRAFETLQETAEAGSEGVVPIGGVIIWSGTTVPDNWALCDGTNGTPNLTDLFVLGAGGTHSPGDTGGASSATTSTEPGHTHAVGTYANSTELDHTHTFSETTSTENGSEAVGAGATDATGQHSHTVSGTTDGAGGHSHTISGNSGSAGGHDHTVATMPPWYALAYIMRTA